MDVWSWLAARYQRVTIDVLTDIAGQV